jgi:hypothetical protein
MCEQKWLAITHLFAQMIAGFHLIILASLFFVGLPMPVSSINAGISGPSLQKGAMAQRAYQQQEIPSTTQPIINASLGATSASLETDSVNVFSSAPIGSQTGVAAYVAIMNPPVATSMRLEA